MDNTRWSGEEQPLILADAITATQINTQDHTGTEEDHIGMMMSSESNNNSNRVGNSINQQRKTFAIATACFIALIVISSSVFVIAPGEIGIVVTMGKVGAFSSGLHYRYPFISQLQILSAKTQLLKEQNTIPTKEGLAVKLDTAILFRLDPTKVADLYRQVGSDYVKILLEPEAASAIRGLTSESEAKALYSSGRTLIQDNVKQELAAKLNPRGIIIEDVLLKDIVLPQQLSKAIELKVEAEQEAARMEFVLQKERQEAERKSIEAQGIADFQRIVSEGISPQLLKWKGVEATEKFANAPNTKLVIIGNDSGGLPVLLSADSD